MNEQGVSDDGGSTDDAVSMDDTGSTDDASRLQEPAVREQVLRLFEQAVLDGAGIGWVEPPSRNEVDELLDDLVDGSRRVHAAVRLVTDDGQVVGLGFWRRYVRPSLAPNADLEKVLVAASHRGRGHGRRLVEQLVADAERAGIEALTLDVRGDNHGAILLYERLGFVEHGRLPGFVAWGDQRWDRVTMLRRLSAARPVPVVGGSVTEPVHLVGWVVLRRPDGRILLARRSGVVYGAGLWGLPGGHVTRGETWAQAAARETLEEVGVVVDPAALQPLAVARYDDDGLQGVDAFFLAESWQGEPAAVSECSQVGWFDPSALPPDSLPWLARSLRRYLLDGEWLDDFLEG